MGEAFPSLHPGRKPGARGHPIGCPHQSVYLLSYKTLHFKFLIPL
jgi:hypothetical protein